MRITRSLTSSAILLAVSALPLCGCAGNPGNPGLIVNVPTTCERVLKDVPLPLVKKTDDARDAFVKDEAALIIARGEIRTGRNCVADMRTRYATGKPK